MTLNHQPPAVSSPVVSCPVVGKRPGRLRSVVLWSCVFCFLLSAFYFFRAPLLRGIANAWIVNDPVAHADAIVILGGGLEYRPFEAARLYTNGCANTILIAQPELPRTAQMGLTVPEFVTARQVLLKLGVPETAIQMIGTNVTSTRDEALALKAWVMANKAHSVVIPTDLFHTRRARWIFQKALRDVRVPTSASGGEARGEVASRADSPAVSDLLSNSPVVSSPVVRGPVSSGPLSSSQSSRGLVMSPCEVHVTAVDLPRYGRTNWWQHEDGLIAFQNEVVKSFYYRLKY